ncbi:unnamed protein product [Fraxinus pennsylvanica]|uniref:ZCF37 n=1 Tax=Fraxinus pennsylvanica TaxID=56036 RepID=A0AAD1Z5F3_9LAMI|nr:unnamed protein product [Fraxinus pennsylvanica]
MLICGSGSFDHQVEDVPETWSHRSTPKRSKKGTGFFRNESKNPYADRGLDKFYALLADLDEKRQKIYTQNGSEDISFVRFVYSNSNDVEPIVVKVKEKKQEKPNLPDVKVQQNSSEAQSDKVSVETLKAPNASDDQVSEPNPKRKHKCLVCRNFKWQKLRQPCYYIPMIIILILILLAVYGRYFAILCTSIGWYLIPTIKGGESSSSRKPKRKKEYVRKLSEKEIVNNERFSSPRSVINGPTDHKSPRQDVHRRSW